MNFRDWINSKDPEAQSAHAVVLADTTGAVYSALRRAFDAGRVAEAERSALRAHAVLQATATQEKH